MLPTPSPTPKSPNGEPTSEGQWLDEARTNIDSPLRINLWLVRDVTADTPGPWMLDRVELNTDLLRSEYRFKKHKEAERSLAEALWDSVVDHLPEDNEDRFVTSPDFLLDLGTIALNRMRVNCSRQVGDVQRALLSFRRTVGTIDGLFRPGCAPDPMSEVRADLATRTLVDLVVPLTNLVDTILPEDNSQAVERVHECLNNLKKARQELDFYALLLSRYISQTDTLEAQKGTEPVRWVARQSKPMPQVSWPKPQGSARPIADASDPLETKSVPAFKA